MEAPKASVTHQGRTMNRQQNQAPDLGALVLTGVLLSTARGSTVTQRQPHNQI